MPIMAFLILFATCTKYDAERVKKNAPRAPTIEEVTATLIAVSASLRAAAKDQPAAKQIAAATAAQGEPAAEVNVD